MFFKNPMRLDYSVISSIFFKLKYLRDRNYVTSSLIEGQPSSTIPHDRKSGMFFCILCGRGISYTT